MTNLYRLFFLSSAIALTTGCAGTNFERPSADAFKLGQTTQAQVTQKMGTPIRSGDAIKNEKPVKSITYAYAATGGEALEAGVIPARAQSYHFHNNVLVSQEFVSSFKSDGTNFDDKKVASIVKGKTTRAEVIALFGKPTASAIAPMVKETAGEAIGYGYNTTRGGAFSGFKFFTKTLRVSFDSKDLVTDVDYTSSGSQ